MAGTKPLVYCIIIHRDGKENLAETLDSVLKMDYPNLKVVITDNGSTDGSQEFVRGRYPTVELIENGTNLGFGGGNNVGMEFAIRRNADWIFLLNDDIKVDPAMLGELIAVGTAGEDIGVLSPKIYYYSEPHTLWYAGGNINFWAGVISHRGLRQVDHGQYDEQAETEYITGCAFLVRRQALERVGFFDPVYHPIYSEDADLSERIRRAGYRLTYVPAAKLWHKVSASSGGGLTPFKTQLKVEHNLIFFKRYARWYHWLTIPWSIGAMTCIFVFRELLKGNFKILTALIKGFGNAFGRLLRNSDKNSG